MDSPSPLESVREEVAQLSGELMGARIDDFNEHALDLERRLPGIMQQLWGTGESHEREAAMALRKDMLRMGALLESISSYARARLAIEQAAAETYGPTGETRRRPRSSTVREA